jgi:NAD-dependent DNA ligase
MTRIELKKYLIRCCYWYYVKADPLISDRAFDGQITLLRKLENCDGVWDKDSPTQMIWGDREDQYPDWARLREGLLS